MSIRVALLLIPMVALATPLDARQRARELGIPFEGTPGPLNAITDVPGFEIGMATIVEGDGPLVVGEGPVRTGVTAIWPRGRSSEEGSFASWYTLNGNGEMTGAIYIQDHGWLLPGPVLITNTLSVGTAHAALIRWGVVNGQRVSNLPVIAETWDGFLNDISGQHVREEHVFQAMDGARGGPVAEGSVGGGTGMICHGFKCGTGTASRVLDNGHTVGVLVQANHGGSRKLTIAGVPVGQALGCMGGRCNPSTGGEEANSSASGFDPEDREGSIIVIVATDAPLLPGALHQLAKRSALGVGRVGGQGETSSGDIMLAIGTGLRREGPGPSYQLDAVMRGLNAYYEATIQATEEAIANALVAGRTTTGRDGNTVQGLPIERTLEILREYGRIR
jgi:D-aminopeptidase